MKLAVPREARPGEKRVAIVPEAVARLLPAGWEVSVEAGAGLQAHFPDEAYVAKGATVTDDISALFRDADAVARVQAPTPEEIGQHPEGSVLVSFLQPAAQLDVVAALAGRRITSFSLDLLPRISRAQAMDALSSQATVSGYRAMLAAANYLPKFFPMFMMAAGTVPPAKVLVLGAGVAGLQAIATARRLGAQVRAYDVRAAAREEVESLGASFVELALESQEGSGGYAREQSEDFLARQREMIAAEVASADAVITTAAIPGRKAPILVTAAMVQAMAGGSVVVDMAADSGGNCELSEPGVDVVTNDVVVHGMSNPPAGMPTHASFLYARNITNFLGLLVSEGQLRPDFEDEIVTGSCVTRDGEVLNAPARELIGASQASGEEKP